MGVQKSTFLAVHTKMFQFQKRFLEIMRSMNIQYAKSQHGKVMSANVA